jgi:hypothetical protein
VTERRPLVIGVIVVALAIAGMADRAGRAGPSRPPAAAVLTANPIARSGSTASTWFCPLANAQPGASADGTIVISNVRTTMVDGTLTVYPTLGDPVAGSIHVPAQGRLVVREQDILKAPAVGAVVELSEGGLAVEQTVAGPLGVATAACATKTATHWYVADGSTALNSAMFLGLFNPFPDDAIVDLDFATDQGHADPGGFQGLVVRGRSVLAVNVGDHVRRRDHVAVAVTARRGRLAVARLEYRTGNKPGLALTLATPALANVWDFPDGVLGDTTAERISVYNPSKVPAVVQVALTLDAGAAEPFELKVAAGDRVTLDPGSESRIPKGVGHAVSVHSDVPVVAEQSLDYGGTGPRQGLSRTLGATTSARRWLLPEGGVTPELEEWVVVHNQGTHRTHVSIFAVTQGHRVALEGVQSIALERGERRVFRMADVVTGPDLPLEVDATAAVVVERVTSRVGKPGVSEAIAVPLL